MGGIGMERFDLEDSMEEIGMQVIIPGPAEVTGYDFLLRRYCVLEQSSKMS